MHRSISTLSIVVLMMLLTFPATADPRVAVRAEGYVGYAVLDLDSVFGSDTTDSFQGGGTGSVSVLLDSIYFQADIFGDATEFENVEIDRVGGGGHLGWRDAQRGSLGVVGAVNHVELLNSEGEEWRAGIEAQAFLDRATVGLNAGFFDGDASSNSNAAELAYIEGNLAFYPTDRARLNLHGGALGVGKENPIGLVGLGGEFLATDFASAFVRWEASLFRSNRIDLDQHSIVAGIRIYFGADEPSLQAYDRTHFNESCLGIQRSGRSC